MALRPALAGGALGGARRALRLSFRHRAYPWPRPSARLVHRLVVDGAVTGGVLLLRGPGWGLLVAAALLVVPR